MFWKLFVTTAATLMLVVAPVHASGWVEYYDCGNGVVPIFGGWHGKVWINGVEANHKAIFDDGDVFKDPGTEADLNQKPKAINADKTDFRFRIKWRGKTVILRYRELEEGGHKVSFAGHACRSMGDVRYEDTEAYKYEQEKK